MDILIVLGGIAFICIIFMLPKWVANITGKTVNVRGRFQTHATYYPKDTLEKTNRELQLLEYPMPPEHGLYYIKTGDKRILDEYKEFSWNDRLKIEMAIEVHPTNLKNIKDIQNLYPDMPLQIQMLSWSVNHANSIHSKLTTIDFNLFNTLSNSEKHNIETFIKLYKVAEKAIRNSD